MKNILNWIEEKKQKHEGREPRTLLAYKPGDDEMEQTEVLRPKRIDIFGNVIPAETLEDWDVTFRRPNAEGGVQQLVRNTVDGSRPGYAGSKEKEVITAYNTLKKKLKRAPSRVELVSETGFDRTTIDAHTKGKLELSKGWDIPEVHEKRIKTLKKSIETKKYDKLVPAKDGNLKGPEKLKKSYLKDLEKRFKFPSTSNAFYKAVEAGKVLDNEALMKKYNLSLNSVEKINTILTTDNKLKYPKQTYEGSLKILQEGAERRETAIKKAQGSVKFKAGTAEFPKGHAGNIYGKNLIRAAELIYTPQEINNLMSGVYDPKKKITQYSALDHKIRAIEAAIEKIKKSNMPLSKKKIELGKLDNKLVEYVGMSDGYKIATLSDGTKYGESFRKLQSMDPMDIFPDKTEREVIQFLKKWKNKTKWNTAAEFENIKKANLFEANAKLGLENAVKTAKNVKAPGRFKALNVLITLMGAGGVTALGFTPTEVKAAEAEAAEPGAAADMSKWMFESGLTFGEKAKVIGTAAIGDVLVNKSKLSKAFLRWLPFAWTPAGDVLIHKLFSGKEPAIEDFAEGLKAGGYDINSEEFKKAWNTIPAEDRKEMLYDWSGKVIDKRSTGEKVSEAAASPWTHVTYAFWKHGVESMQKLLAANPGNSALTNKLKQAALFGIRMGIPMRVISAVNPIGWTLTAGTAGYKMKNWADENLQWKPLTEQQRTDIQERKTAVPRMLDTYEQATKLAKDQGISYEDALKQLNKPNVPGIDFSLPKPIETLAGGGMVGIRKPSAIAPTGGPMSQGLRSLYNNGRKW